MLISVDSPLRSNLSVGLPLGLATIRNDRLRIDSHQTIDSGNIYFQMIHTRWGEALLHASEALPEPERLFSAEDPCVRLGLLRVRRSKSLLICFNRAAFAPVRR